MDGLPLQKRKKSSDMVWLYISFMFTFTFKFFIYISLHSEQKALIKNHVSFIRLCKHSHLVLTFTENAAESKSSHFFSQGTRNKMNGDLRQQN